MGPGCNRKAAPHARTSSKVPKSDEEWANSREQSGPRARELSYSSIGPLEPLLASCSTALRAGATQLTAVLQG